MTPEVKPKKALKRTATLAGVIAIVMHLMSFFGAGAAVLRYRWKFLPYHFVLMMISSAFVLSLSAVIKRFWPSVHDQMQFDPERLKSRFWKWAITRGALLAATIMTMLFGPVFTAGFIQSLGVSGKRAWAYATLANIVAAVGLVVFWIYLRNPIDAHLGHIHWIHRLLH